MYLDCANSVYEIYLCQFAKVKMQIILKRGFAKQYSRRSFDYFRGSGNGSSMKRKSGIKSHEASKKKVVSERLVVDNEDKLTK